MRFELTRHLAGMAIGLFCLLGSFCAFSSIDHDEMQKRALAKYSEDIMALKEQVAEKVNAVKMSSSFQEVQTSTQRALKQNEGHLSPEIMKEREVLVFVSMSMSDEAVKQWMREAEKYDASLNVRGLIGDTLPKSIDKMQKLFIENGNQGGISIDPALFEQYGIEKVPAVVLRTSEDEASPYDVIYGTSSIAQALQIINEEGEVK